MTRPAALPDERMTWRARAYIFTSAGQHLIVGTACIVRSKDFEGDAFEFVRQIMPMWGWGLVFLAGGLHLTYAAVHGSELAARVGMPLSAGLTAVWAAAFVIAYLEGGVVSVVGATFAAALTLKELIICAQPMRSPFEPLVKEYVGPTPRPLAKG